MKKNVLALSVVAALAGFAGAASAQQVPFLPNTGVDNAASQFVINDGGVGHILLTPYFTVQGQRNTLLNIVNTDTANGKAVKVRFRGARNSDDLFDFYVFLSPGDNWRARVYREEDAVKVDVSSDTSCTLPSRDEFAGAAFSTLRVYNGEATELREGYVEMLAAADIPKGSDLYKTIKHDENTGKVTCNTNTIFNSLAALTTVEAAKANGLSFPTTGLIGHWAITDVYNDSTVSGNMTAVEARTDAGLAGAGNIVVAPQEGAVAPEAWATTGTADPLLVQGRITPLYFDFPDLSTPYLGAEATATAHANRLSGDLAVSTIINEFTTKIANFRTDWVFSLPTRRYAVAIDYAKNDEVVKAAGSQFFQGATKSAVNGKPTIAVPGKTAFFDQNERTAGTGTSFSPGTTTSFALRGEVSVLSFNANGNGSVLGAELTAGDVVPRVGFGGTSEVIETGWGTVTLDNAGPVKGLPIIGYAAVTAGGKNLGFSWPHRYTRPAASPVVPE